MPCYLLIAFFLPPHLSDPKSLGTCISMVTIAALSSNVHLTSSVSENKCVFIIFVSLVTSAVSGTALSDVGSQYHGVYKCEV